MVMRPEKKPHVVEAHEGGFFRVTSGTSGTVYTIEAKAPKCTCMGFQKRASCSHLDAVVKAMLPFAGDADSYVACKGECGVGCPSCQGRV